MGIVELEPSTGYLVASPSRVSDPRAGRGRQFIVGQLFADGCRRFTVDLAMALYCRINSVGALEDVSGSEASPSGLLKEGFVRRIVCSTYSAGC